jgi:hypothetical protein
MLVLALVVGIAGDDTIHYDPKAPGWLNDYNEQLHKALPPGDCCLQNNC